MKQLSVVFSTFLLFFFSAISYGQESFDITSHTGEQDLPLKFEHYPPFTQDWSNFDVLVDTGVVKGTSSRQIALKTGPDGSMFMAVNKNSNGEIRIFRSANAGLTWFFIGGVTAPAAFIGQISMLAENRSSTVSDSTRIIVFYTRSATSNLYGASVYWFSIKRDGTGFIGGTQAANPINGNKFNFPSAVSNGQYEAENTSFGFIVGEYQNLNTRSYAIRYYRSTNWGATFQGVAFDDSQYINANDYYHSADFKKGSTDSVLFAVERKSSTDTVVRLFATPFTPTVGAFNSRVIASGSSYQKPVLTIQQNGDYANNTRNMMITMVKNNGQGVYSYSLNSGISWVNDNLLGNPNKVNTAETWCSSDSMSAGGNYFAACDLNTAGDSLTVRKGTLTDMGPINTNQNSNLASSIVSPVCAIYNASGLKLSTFTYAGAGQSNIYFDGEHLPTSVSGNNNGIPEKYLLSQNYPNPFNPSTKINFAVPVSSFVKITVFDILGKEVALLVNQNLTAGSYTADFNAANISGGVYFYRITANDGQNSFVETKKMLLIK